MAQRDTNLETITQTAVYYMDQVAAKRAEILSSARALRYLLAKEIDPLLAQLDEKLAVARRLVEEVNTKFNPGAFNSFVNLISSCKVFSAHKYQEYPSFFCLESCYNISCALYDSRKPMTAKELREKIGNPQWSYRDVNTLCLLREIGVAERTVEGNAPDLPHRITKKGKLVVRSLLKEAEDRARCKSDVLISVAPEEANALS